MTLLLKLRRNELRPILRPNDRRFPPFRLPYGDGLSQNPGGICRFTGQSEVIRNNTAIADIDDPLPREKSVFPYDGALCQVGLPQLIRARNHPIARQSPRIDGFPLSLRPQECHLATEAVHFLFVNGKTVPPSQTPRELLVAIGGILVFQNLDNPLHHLSVRNLLSLPR